MSAAGRGGARRPGDHYPTPEGCVRAILPYLPAGGRVLDPGCGEGAILRVLREDYAFHESPLVGVEVDRMLAETARTNLNGQASIHNDDFLAGHVRSPWEHHGYSLVIGNPPYSRALEFFVEGLRLAAPKRGTVALLLRLAFLESTERVAFHEANPCDVYVLSPRPSFTGDGASDMSAYAWFVSGPGRTGHVRSLRWDKPKKER